ncbi:thioredoxin [Clostridium tepidiprofundi DSM 19306]|uniref:Thioredoxin n=1 Tax=Clostridium tepidiprofundi DSM 19306 TaxID=1121338 RepID=A0A151B2L6_9CLOT|nr:thioredoxin family protein [Clostridium tepidiprofundi]KYH34023.1 thioredoxin [Clostridium tepidiprofundi DSM 19306]
MKRLSTFEEIDEFIKSNDFSLLYFGLPNCDVCDALFPKVQTMLEDYPNIKLGRVYLNENAELGGKFSIFTVPAILVYIEGKEAIREARFINMDLLENSIKRYYDMFY